LFPLSIHTTRSSQNIRSWYTLMLILHQNSWTTHTHDLLLMMSCTIPQKLQTWVCFWWSKWFWGPKHPWVRLGNDMIDLDWWEGRGFTWISCVAADKEMSEKIFPISLGQGQGPKATVMINDAQVSGLHIIFFILPLIEPLNCKQLKYIWVLMRCNIYIYIYIYALWSAMLPTINGLFGFCPNC
jgi:hypothetical protein